MTTDEESPSYSAAAEAHGEELHPVDAEWLTRKSPVAPVILGILSVASSPILLGLFFGPLGLRAGIDLRRRGVRGAGTAFAIVASTLGIILSITTALLWGAVLSSVLLGRDAMRAAEAWRGKVIPATTVDALLGGQPVRIDLSRPTGAAQRQAILIIDIGQPTCDAAVRTLSEVAVEFPDVAVVVLDRDTAGGDVWDFVRLHGLESVGRFACVGPLDMLPQPLDQAAAIPTFVVVSADGAVEQAIVGLHPAEDIAKLMGGAGALPAEGTSRKAGD